LGVTGYCMGGRLALIAAGTPPNRIAAASYNGGYLADERPDSPHLLADQIRARVYVAGAIEGPAFPPEMKERLELAVSAFFLFSLRRPNAVPISVLTRTYGSLIACDLRKPLNSREKKRGS
jgi:Dienelactone hydrolase family